MPGGELRASDTVTRMSSADGPGDVLAYDPSVLDGLVKLRFALDVDADGWPPVGSEGVWAEPLGCDRYRIRNTPWFVQDLAVDDVVTAEEDADGILWAGDWVSWSDGSPSG